MLPRAAAIHKRIKEYQPRVVIFYGSAWHRYWGMIARVGWNQAINGRLMGGERDGIAYYVTRHPVVESDAYFQEIGLFLRRKHGGDLYKRLPK
jgi:hypothetical protein